MTEAEIKALQLIARAARRGIKRRQCMEVIRTLKPLYVLKYLLYD